MKKIFALIVMGAIISGGIILISCSSKTITEIVDEENEFLYSFGRFSIDLVKTEKTMKKFASVLPYLFENENFATILYNEMNTNLEIVDADGDVDGEAFVLWSTISYYQVDSLSIRELVEVEVENLPPDGESPEEFIRALDEICYLQLYMHCFKEYDPNIPIQVTYIPIFENGKLVDDMDIQNINVYDNEGNNIIMDISDSDYEPEYPLAVVGINELLLFEELSMDNSDFNKCNTLNNNRSTTGRIYLTKICVRRPKSLESWLGGKAEMVVRRLGSSSHNYKRFRRKSYCSISREKTTNKLITSNCHEQMNGYHNYCAIEVFEWDWTSNNEEIIENGFLYNVGFEEGGYGLTVESHNRGSYYWCGSYVRCDYEFEYVPPTE